jgi:hypothetical protein
MLPAVRLALTLLLVGWLAACASTPSPKQARSEAASEADARDHAKAKAKRKKRNQKRRSDSGPPDLGHGLSKEEVRSVLRKMDAGVSGCYALEFAGKKHGGGRIVVAIRIARTGKIKRAVVSESTFANASFEGCVADMAGRLEFPVAKGETEVVKAYSLEKKD